MMWNIGLNDRFMRYKIQTIGTWSTEFNNEHIEIRNMNVISDTYQNKQNGQNDNSQTYITFMSINLYGRNNARWFYYSYYSTYSSKQTLKESQKHTTPSRSSRRVINVQLRASAQGES